MSVDILGINCHQCVCMVQCRFTFTETIRFIRTGSPGPPPRLSFFLSRRNKNESNIFDTKLAEEGWITIGGVGWLSVA